MEKSNKRFMEKWSEMEDSLIDQVRKHPILYKCDAKSYKHTVIKENKWKEIAASLNLKRGECKVKWKGIRDGYRRNRLLELQGKGNRRSKYSDERLDFLKVTVRNPRDKDSEFKVEDERQDDKEYDKEEEMRELQPEPSFQEINEHFLENANNFMINEKDVLVEELRRGREERYELMRLMGSITMSNQSETPVHSFFKSMAEVVSLFPANKIAEVRMKVCKVVSDMEIDCLREGNTSDMTMATSCGQKTADSTRDENTEFIGPEIELIESND